MTIMHIINFAIPIAFMAFFGYLLDRASRPAKSSQEESGK